MKLETHISYHLNQMIEFNFTNDKTKHTDITYLLISCTEKGTVLLRWYSCQKFLPNFYLFMKKNQIHIESFTITLLYGALWVLVSLSGK